MKGERHKHEGRKAEAGRMVGRDRTDELKAEAGLAKGRSRNVDRGRKYDEMNGRKDSIKGNLVL